MELHEALAEIAIIRRRVAVVEKFEGYRALPVASGGALAVVGAIAQGAFVANPAENLNAYLGLWVGVAALAGSLTLVDLLRTRHMRSPLRVTQTRLACEQFAPCVAAGGLVTWVIAAFAPQVGWMLPGLWAVLFSLGLFASFRLLPAPILVVGAWYLLCGCTWLAWGAEGAGLAPWTMGVAFGGGQLATAAVLSQQPAQEARGAS